MFTQRCEYPLQLIQMLEGAVGIGPHGNVIAINRAVTAPDMLLQNKGHEPLKRRRSGRQAKRRGNELVLAHGRHERRLMDILLPNSQLVEAAM